MKTKSGLVQGQADRGGERGERRAPPTSSRRYTQRERTIMVTCREEPQSSLALAGAWGVGSLTRSPRLALRWSRWPGAARH